MGWARRAQLSFARTTWRVQVPHGPPFPSRYGLIAIQTTFPFETIECLADTAVCHSRGMGLLSVAASLAERISGGCETLMLHHFQVKPGRQLFLPQLNSGEYLR